MFLFLLPRETRKAFDAIKPLTLEEWENLPVVTQVFVISAMGEATQEEYLRAAAFLLATTPCRPA